MAVSTARYYLMSALLFPCDPEGTQFISSGDPPRSVSTPRPLYGGRGLLYSEVLQLVTTFLDISGLHCDGHGKSVYLQPMVERRDRHWSLAACWTGRGAQYHFLVPSSNTSSLASFISFSAIASRFPEQLLPIMRNSLAARRCLGVLDWVVCGWPLRLVAL